MTPKKKTRDQGPQHVGMRIAKKQSSRKDRTALREALHHNRFDEIPTDRRIKVEDVWGWD